MKDRISITMLDGGIADVRLIRTDKMNALDPAMWDALAQAVDELKATAGLRVVVLSGEGRAFCAGLDLSSLSNDRDPGASSAGGSLADRTRGIANNAQYAAWGWRELPVPVIAAVHGVALGGGFQLALAADMRYVAPGTRLGLIETRWGLVPDMAGMQLMRGLVRDDVARELVYTARIFSAEEALAFGFATRLVDEPRKAALVTAREIAARSPDAIRAAKRLLNQAMPDGAEEMLTAETEEQRRLLGSANHAEAVRASFEKRTPVFVDPPHVSFGA